MDLVNSRGQHLSPLAPLAIMAFGALTLWITVRGIRRGVLPTKSSRVERATNPTGFWIYAVVLLLSGTFLVVFPLVIILRGLRP